MANSSARRTFSGRPLIERRKRLPLHELEDEKPLIALLAALEQHGDVWMRQLDELAPRCRGATEGAPDRA